MKLSLIGALVLPGIALASLTWRTTAPGISVGAPAPVFEFTQTWNLSGVEGLEELRGRVVLLDFWRTW